MMRLLMFWQTQVVKKDVCSYLFEVDVVEVES